jgi:hypothetical protein
MYAVHDFDGTASDSDDDDDIPELIPADTPPQLLTYYDHCLYNCITLVKSKL